MAAVQVNIDLDVWHYITANRGTSCKHRGYTLYQKEDFSRFETLPSDWYYQRNEHGEGRAIEFPIKAKPIVAWSTSRCHVVNGKLQKRPRMPIERVSLHCVRRACDTTNT